MHIAVTQMGQDNMQLTPKLKICVAAAQGGHLTEILKLQYIYECHNHFYVLNDGPINMEIKSAPVYIMPDYGSGNPILRSFRLLILIYRSVILFYRERPDVIISTGPLTGLFIAILVRLRGGQVLFIECSAQVTHPSRSGRLFYLISNCFYIQWESLKEYYPNAEYRGLLL